MKYASLVESGSPGAVQTPPPAAPPAVPAAADSQTRPLLLPPAFFQGKTPGGQVRLLVYWVATVLHSEKWTCKGVGSLSGPAHLQCLGVPRLE